jgi:GMP synthase-like glutamine amidotransferase
MRKKRIHIFQHDPAVGAGYVSQWIEYKGHLATITRFFNDDPLPDIAEIDWLIICGGSMGVYDYDQYPWLYEEKRCIEAAIQSHKVVVGLCLGAQLIAEVMGARIYKSKYPEIGWFPVELSTEMIKSPWGKGMVKKVDAFHWHEDNFDLPESAIRLGSSEGCLNQGFVFSDHVLGIQFHPESTPEGVRLLVEQAGHDYLTSRYTQPPETLVNDAHGFESMHKFLGDMLDRAAEIHTSSVKSVEKPIRIGHYIF